MKTIEIDDDVWNALQAKATPLVDTPNTMLRRILGLPNQKLPGMLEPSRRITPGGRAKGRTPQQVYRQPILRSLYHAGGAKAVNEVLDDIERALGDQLNDVDRQRLNSGRDVRWRNAAQWERAVMVRVGILKSDSPRGIWELTVQGMRIAREDS